MEVTIVIPNFNGLKFIKPCLKSLEKQSYKNFKLIIVDNGSTDGSKEWFKGEGIDFIDLDTNLGFAGACNLAETLFGPYKPKIAFKSRYKGIIGTRLKKYISAVKTALLLLKNIIIQDKI